MDDAETRRVIAECIRGDDIAIERLINEHQAGVFRLAYSLLGDPHDANEVAQDTFITALNKLGTYQERSSFRAWLYTIALNLSRDRLRKQRAWDRLKSNLITLLHIQVQKRLSAEEMLAEAEQKSTIIKAINNLNDKHRIPIMLRYYQGLSISEIAEVLNINEGTVHSRLHTAHQRLRMELNNLSEGREQD